MFCRLNAGLFRLGHKLHKFLGKVKGEEAEWVASNLSARNEHLPPPGIRRNSRLETNFAKQSQPDFAAE